MIELRQPTAPLSGDRWAWERYYTDSVELLMQAREGERPLQPSEVSDQAKASTVAAYSTTVAGDTPQWLAELGAPVSSVDREPSDEE